MSNQTLKMILGIAESVCLIFGPALVALHLFDFHPGKRGYYYSDGNEWGIAAGVLLISAALVARYWRKHMPASATRVASAGPANSQARFG